MPTETPARRPGGRSARVQESVYTAVGQLMAESKPDRITIPMVAQRADVNATSVYRRWGDIDALLEEVAVAALTREGDMLPDTGSIAGDLTAWATIIAEDIAQPKRTRYLRALVSARDGLVPECPCWGTRQQQSAEMIARARSRGEATPSVEQVLDHVIAPLYHHVVFGLPIDAAYAERLVRDVLVLAR
ncbi:TetR/AcrR family transcriptional regulator [Calidifontibacter terrae]